MLRLADQILLSGLKIPEQYREHNIPCMPFAKGMIAGLEAGIPVIIADDIVDYTRDHAGARFTAKIHAPFPCFFIEANDPSGCRSLKFAQGGWFITTPKLSQLDLERFPTAKWRIDIQPLVRYAKTSQTTMFDFGGTLLLEDDGTILNFGGPEFTEEIRDIMQAIIFDMPLCVLALMSCSNTKLADAPGNNQRDSWYRRQRQPKLRFSTIEIGGAVKTRSNGSTGTGTAMGLHLARAHMREYREDGPGLFGKGIYGKFLIPAHARGSAKNGVIRSTYNVKAPKHG